MAIDDATAGFLAQLAVAGPPIYLLTPAEARLATRAMASAYGPGPELDSVRDERVPVPGGEVLARVMLPVPDPAGILVFLHGGGWVIGSADEYDTLARILAARTGFTVVLVEYRKAPEHRYPVAVDDCWAALGWVDSRREELAAPGAPLVLMGDSAGGNLTAVLAQRVTRSGGPRIDLQVLVYPVVDCDFERASYRAPENQLMLNGEASSWFWQQYAPDPGSRLNPTASPIRATDLSGQPPAVVLIAEHDLLRDEDEAYVARLEAAGVPVRHKVFTGQMHGFFQLVLLPGCAEGVDYAAATILELLGAARS